MPIGLFDFNGEKVDRVEDRATLRRSRFFHDIGAVSFYDLYRI